MADAVRLRSKVPSASITGAILYGAFSRLHRKTERGGLVKVLSPPGQLARWTLLLLLSGLFPAVEAQARLPHGAGEKLPVLRTARAIHDLSGAEAARGYPIDLLAVVTYSDPQRSTLFLHDATGGVYALADEDSMELQPGTLVEVRGISAPGAFAPIVDHPEVNVRAKSHLPAFAPRVNLLRLQTGAEDSQWIEIEGIVHLVTINDHEAILELVTLDGTIHGTTLKIPGVDYAHLTDAHVLVRATAAAVFNDNHQMIGPRLVIPDLSAVRVLEAAPADPFETAIEPISALSRFTMQFSEVHRVHLHGRVTLVWPGSLVCVADSTGGLCAQTSESPDVRVGMEADVIGFPANGQSAPILTDAEARRAGYAEAIDGAPLTGPEALSMTNDARLIELSGELMGKDLTASETTLIVSSAGGMYRAVLPKALMTGDGTDWKPGSRLRLRGICSVQVDAFRSVELGGHAVAKAYRLLLRSPADIVVLSQPSWWSPNHSLLVVGGFLVMTSLVLVWVAALRRTVEQQTKTIRESEMRFKHMAQHDALTGLPTRTLLHDRLHDGLERCRRDGTGLALLMVDLDHFKAINDTYGHNAGDMALKVTAERMLGAVRGVDTVARMGGDEFLVLLTDMQEVYRAETIAAELVRVVSRPFVFEGREVPVTASVGVCASLSDQFDAEGLLKNVDAAMYRAKAQGRNRFQMAGPLVMAGARS